MLTRQSVTHIVDNISPLTIIITDKNKWKTQPVNCYKIINNPIPTRSEAIKWQIHFSMRRKSERYFSRWIIKKTEEEVSTDALFNNNRCQKCNQTFFIRKKISFLITFQLFSTEMIKSRRPGVASSCKSKTSFLLEISTFCYLSLFLWVLRVWDQKLMTKTTFGSSQMSTTFNLRSINNETLKAMSLFMSGSY